jgi:hypothetical protein
VASTKLSQLAGEAYNQALAEARAEVRGGMAAAAAAVHLPLCVYIGTSSST